MDIEQLTVKRPKLVNIAVLAIGVAVLLSLLTDILSYDVFRERFVVVVEGNVAFVQFFPTMFSTLLLINLALYLFFLMMLYKGYGWVRGILLIGLLFSLGELSNTLQFLFGASAAETALPSFYLHGLAYLADFILRLVAIILLFQRRSRIWYTARKGERTQNKLNRLVNEVIIDTPQETK